MVHAIIVAAGSGSRLNRHQRKQYMPINKCPILGHTLRTFDRCPGISSIVLVVPETDFELCNESVINPLKLRKQPQLIAGGSFRQESVYNGLSFFNDTKAIVVIHDGVRPFIEPDLISMVIDGANETGACIAAIPVQDTVKRVNQKHFITATVDRKTLWRSQTPQAFDLRLIRKAHERALKENIQGSDDAFLVERLGIPVKIIPGSRLNIKITTPADLDLAEAMALTKTYTTSNQA